MLAPCRSLLLLLFACSLPASLHAQSTVPPGGDPALACKQRPNGRAYWTEYGFCDLPVKGPAQAKGLALWSHGLAGDKEQFNGAPPPVVRAMQLVGWDVIRINRNNLYEKGWEASGTRHRDDAIERLRAAKAQGYRYVVLAGQSYGAMISLEANAKSAEVDGVLAFSPGHGSDAGQGALGGRDGYRNLNRYLLNAVAAQKGGRVVVLIADGDTLHPDRGLGSGFGGQLRAALAPTGRPYVVFDETSPIRGHGAGTTSQFATWYGGCVLRFLDPAQSVAPGETVCRPPNPVPQFLLPTDLKRPAPGAAGPARWLGAWQGTFGDTHRDVMVVVEEATPERATVVYAPGAGPHKDLGMGWARYRDARVKGDSIIVDRGNNLTLTLVPSADGRTMSIEHTLSNAPSLKGSLTRAGN
jgi:hypothetical protein